MNKNKILGIVRHVLTFGGGFAVAKGWLDEASIEQVTGAIVTLVGTAWSIFAPEKR
jgi:hypothetical protein